MKNLSSKRAVLSIAACAAVVALTFAGMAVSTTSGAGTDTAPVATLTAAPAPTSTPAAAPPQAPIEPPASATGPDYTGNQAGAGTLPSAGYGDTGSNSNAMFFIALAGAILSAGTALTVAGRSRKQ